MTATIRCQCWHAVRLPFLRLRHAEPDARRGIDTIEASFTTPVTTGSFEEPASAAPARTRAFAGGAVLSISVKSGGDQPHGTACDYAGESDAVDNVPDYLQTNTPNEDGFFCTATGLCFQRGGETICKGNATQKQSDQRRRWRSAVEAEGLFLPAGAQRQRRLHHRQRDHAALKLSNKVHVQRTFQAARAPRSSAT